MGLFGWLWERVSRSRTEDPIPWKDQSPYGPLRADGGEEQEKDEENMTEGESDVERSSIEITDPGESEPADPKREKPDLDDIPDFEVRADEPVAGGENEAATDDRDVDPTAGRPNTARSPGQARIGEEDTERYLAALELCARLPEDIRLPEEAADLVPAAVEAELENNVQAFAAAEFDNRSPHVETLTFIEVDDEIWVRLRLGVPPGACADLDPDEIRTHALQQVEGVF